MTGKSPEAFRTISEVADWLDRPAHVLRFWESKFSQVKPVKRAGGRRYYRPDDMLLLGGIKKLLHDDGMTIKGAQKVLREQGVRYVSALSQPLDDDGALSAATTLVPDAAANLHSAPAAATAVTAPEPAPEKPIAAPFDAKPEQATHSIDDHSVDDDATAATAPHHATSHGAEQIESPATIKADTTETDTIQPDTVKSDTVKTDTMVTDTVITRPAMAPPAMETRPIDQTQPPRSPSADANTPTESPKQGQGGDATQSESRQDGLSETAPPDTASIPHASLPPQPPADPIVAKALGADIPPDPDPSLWPPEPGVLSQIAALSGPIALANRAGIAALIARLDAMRSHMATARKS
ncbi:MAG: MerR family transcriptional regulator [Rhodobacterales bacterium]